MSQAVGVRLVRRLSTALGGNRETICAALPEIERELIADLSRSITQKAYAESARHANELLFLSQVESEVCVRRRGGGGRRGGVYEAGRRVAHSHGV